MYTVAFTAILSTMIKQNVMGFTTDRALKYFCMFFTIHTETCHGMMVPWIMDVKIIIDDRVFRTTKNHNLLVCNQKWIHNHSSSSNLHLVYKCDDYSPHKSILY